MLYLVDHPELAADFLEERLVGNEGVSGISLILDIEESPLKAIVQGEGVALRMAAPEFLRAMQASRSFARILNAYLYFPMGQIAQSAACA